MTVKELRDALRKVPNDVEVSILIDSWESERRNPWMAHHDTSIEEDGTETTYFTINC